jgi:parallel beta-helix repeat protein
VTGSASVLTKLSVFGNIKTGAKLASYARVSDSQFQGNGTGGSGDGLDVGQNAVVTHCVFSTNKGYGLNAYGGGVVVVGNTASNNTVTGFETNGSSVLKDNTATGNTVRGFCDDCGGGKGSTFKSNVATGNGNSGIEFFASTAISNNASNNGDFGIADDGLSTVANNTANNNTFDGLVSSDLSTFTGNTGSANGRYGFNINCPVNLIGNTAVGDPSGDHITVGCNSLDNLGF